MTEEKKSETKLQEIIKRLKTLKNSLNDDKYIKVYPIVNPAKFCNPYITYNVISNQLNSLGGDCQTFNLQLDYFSNQYADLVYMGKNIIAVLDGNDELEQIGIYELNSSTSYEAETKLYRLMIEFSYIEY